jgi:enoyl-CoA hydratase/carnithine racemase
VEPSDVALVAVPLRDGIPVLDSRAVRSLIGTLTELERAGTGAAVLTADGDDFCVGGDHDEARRLEPAELRALLADIARLERLLRTSSFPVVGFARGRVIGGGVELLLACDLIVADPSASFGTPHVRANAPLGPGPTAALVARVGSSWARRMLLLGERVSASTAAAIGLADRILDSPDGRASVLAIAAKLGSLPARSLARTRADLDRAELSLGDALGLAIARLGP